ncbi:MAG: DUF1289 domain-containing protein [Alphaproteobacteria bacterium]|nr:DUF1289 domain-containing protein [Alphaproteobacteria bacterium]
MMDSAPRPAIETPCVKVCVVDPETQLCIGCGRTRPEIAGWLGMAPEQRHLIVEQLPERLATLTLRKTRRGGRAGRIARS